MLHLLCLQLCVYVWKDGIQINVINRSASREMFRLMGLDMASSCLKEIILDKKAVVHIHNGVLFSH